jgi:DNA-binding CsgD family transcriptional regulator
VLAWHLNAIHFLDVPRGRTGSGSSARGLVDRFGVLHNAEPGLTALFRRETPDWEGPNIPAALQRLIENGAKEYIGQTLIASLVRELPDRMCVISVRTRAAIDTLSRRELAVAREFASGRTYREIAGLFGTSPATVRSQLQIVYTKLGVRSKIDLVKHVDRSV